MLGKKLITAGFQEPAGLVGLLGGRLMARGNAATERHVVELAACRPGEVALVLGPGPGVGVRALLDEGVEVVAVDPSPVMLEATLRRCRDVVTAGARLTLRPGTAEEHGVGDAAVDAVISVNNVMIWPDRRAGLVAVHRALRPGGRVLLSAHRTWLPAGLADDCVAAGLESVEEWTWDPPSRGASTAVLLRARRPG